MMIFGYSVSLSSDGKHIGCGCSKEKAVIATGIGGDEDDNSAPFAGAVYVFSRSGTTWTQQAYVKSSNNERLNYFGASVSLSSDGNTLAVGAYNEDSAAGAVYLY